MKIDRAVRRARGLFQAKRVYGEPVERDGVTVVPAAEIYGGAGGGGGEGPDGNPGGGGGFGIFARPVGAWVIRDDRAQWKPAIDVGRLLVAALLALTVLAWLSRRSP